MKKFPCCARAEERRLSLSLRAGGLALLACAMVCSAILLTLIPSNASADVDPAFLTPEDAIRHFCQALAANDFEAALGACAVREQAEGFDLLG